MKSCVLEERRCNGCGQCDDRCDLDPSKVCDNCFRCLDTDGRAYIEIPIGGVFLPDEDYIPEQPIIEYATRRHANAQTLFGLHATRLKREGR